MRNLKCALSMLALATTLSLTGCGNQSSNENVKELENAILSLQEENELLKEKLESLMQDKIVEMTPTKSEKGNEIPFDIEESQTIETTKPLTDIELNDLAYEIEKELESHYYFHYYNGTGTVDISRKTEVEDNNYEISEELYSKMNLLLQQSSILKLNDIDDKLDLSKLDGFNLEKLEIVDVNLDLVKSLIQQVSSKGGNVNYAMYGSISTDDTKKIVNFFTANNIKLHVLYLSLKNDEAFPEICDQLQNVNSEMIFLHVRISETEINKVANMAVKLHDNTTYFDLSFENFYNSDYLTELGDIKISSNNPNLHISIYDALVTENTEFFINCDTPNISLSGDHTSVIPFYGLMPAKNFRYTNDNNGIIISYWDKDYSANTLIVYGSTIEETIEYSNVYFEDAINQIEQMKGKPYIK